MSWRVAPGLLPLLACAGSSPWPPEEEPSDVRILPAEPTDPDAPRQPVLHARGIFTGERAQVPVAPEGCMSRVRIRVPYAACERPGLAEHLDTRRMEQLQRHRDERGGGEVRARLYRGTPAGSDPVPASCSLSCTPDEGTAAWLLRLEEGGKTGTVRCAVGEVAGLELDLVEVGQPVADGIGLMWLADLSEGYRVSVKLGPDGDEDEKITTLLGDNFCPAGQPTREGGVVGALDAPAEPEPAP